MNSKTHLIHGDSSVKLEDLEENRFHSCVTSSNETDEKIWQEVKDVLRPGGHLAAVIKIQDHYKVMVAIENAGFEIRDAVACLVDSDSFENFEINYYMTVLARKPLSEDNVAQNFLKHETGAINIDGCRIGQSKEVPASNSNASSGVYGDFTNRSKFRSGMDSNTGRWPANFMLDKNTSEILDEQSGESEAPGGPGKGFGYDDNSYQGAGLGSVQGPVYPNESGGASRYFYTPKDFSEEFENSDLVGLMCYLIRLLTPEDGVVLDPFLSNSSVGVAAILENRKFIGNGEESSHADIKFAAENANQFQEKYTSNEKQKNDKDSTVEHNFWD